MTPRSSAQEQDNSSLPSPPLWKGLRSLDFVYRHNDRCLELLALSASDAQPDSPLALVHQHRALWQRLEPAARQRAARLPFLLVDVHFADAGWWRAVRATPSVPNSETYPSFPKVIADPLITETLMFVWYVVQSHPGDARLMVGLSREVHAIIGALSTHEVCDIAARTSHAIRPRWAHAPEIWGELLAAAHRNDYNALAEIHAHVQLRFVGDLLSGFH